MKRFAMAAIVAIMASQSAMAQAPIALDRFDRIELRGGGHVVLRHGPAQRVTMLRGDPAMTRFTVEDERLVIEACIRSCGRYDLQIEIVVPDIEAVAVQGGGAIRMQGDSSPRELVAAVTGGGLIDTTAASIPSLVAAVQGGGVIRARVVSNLVASVMGGGAITYWGDPHVIRSISGGGSIRSGGGR
ncbi:MAG: DUF2807 domain-containing protein [Sphingomonas sp.]